MNDIDDVNDVDDLENVDDEGRRENSLRNVLRSKTSSTLHEKLDIEPKVGGRDLLHDEFGLPRGGSNNKKRLPVIKEISNEPVKIKASAPNLGKVQYAKPNLKFPVVLADSSNNEEELDDNFVPPKSNFVSVGQHDHVWYNDRVAGSSSKKAKSQMIDNNDDVDTDSLQGINPLHDNPEIANYKNTLKNVRRAVLTQLPEVSNPDDLELLFNQVFGQKGVFESLLVQFKQMSQENRTACSVDVQNLVEDLKSDFSNKEVELGKETFNSQESKQDEYQPEKSEEASESSEESILSMEEGQFAIFVDSAICAVADDTKKVKAVLTQLIIGNDVDISRIHVFKKVHVDFGIILDE